VAVLVALVAALTASSSPAAPRQRPRAPSGLAFYRPPARLLAGRHGSVIWSRPARGTLRLAGAKRALVVLYRSRSLTGTPIAVSGTVWVPKGRPPKRGWPIISWAHGTTGVGDPCAPSRDSPTSLAHGYIDYVYPELSAWLKAGYAVIQTDYQGLGTAGPHPYLIGVSEGRGVDDIVRAARELVPALGRRFAIAGHSQGGQASLFAASIARGWVPELKLVGDASYAPASHIADQIKLVGAFTAPSPISALGAEVLYGAAAGSPAVSISALMAPPALALMPQLEVKCEPQLIQPDSFGGLAPNRLLASGANLGPLLALTGRQNPAVSIPVPILLAQGGADATVPKPFTDQLAGELRAKHDRLDYRVYPGITHGQIPAAAQPVFMRWVAQRFGRR